MPLLISPGRSVTSTIATQNAFRPAVSSQSLMDAGLTAAEIFADYHVVSSDASAETAGSLSEPIVIPRTTSYTGILRFGDASKTQSPQGTVDIYIEPQRLLFWPRDVIGADGHARSVYVAVLDFASSSVKDDFVLEQVYPSTPGSITVSTGSTEFELGAVNITDTTSFVTALGAAGQQDFINGIDEFDGAVVSAWSIDTDNGVLYLASPRSELEGNVNIDFYYEKTESLEPEMWDLIRLENSATGIILYVDQDTHLTEEHTQVCYMSEGAHRLDLRDFSIVPGTLIFSVVDAESGDAVSEDENCFLSNPNTNPVSTESVPRGEISLEDFATKDKWETKNTSKDVWIALPTFFHQSSTMSPRLQINYTGGGGSFTYLQLVLDVDNLRLEEGSTTWRISFTDTRHFKALKAFESVPSFAHFLFTEDFSLLTQDGDYAIVKFTDGEHVGKYGIVLRTTAETGWTGAENNLGMAQASIEAVDLVPYGFYAVDYKNGIVYTNRPMKSTWTVTAEYEYTDFRASYKVHRRLVEGKDFLVDDSGNVQITASEFAYRRQLPGIKSPNYLISYNYTPAAEETSVNLASYYTPILKDYSLKILTKSRLF